MEIRRSMRFVLSWMVLLAVANIAAAQTPSGGRLLVLLRNASALAFVDPASGKVLGKVPVGRDPHEVAVTPDGTTAFVASPGVGISMIDVAAMKEIRKIDMRSPVYSTPVAANGTLFIATPTHLYAIAKQS